MRCNITGLSVRSIVLIASIVGVAIPSALTRAEDVVTVRLSDGHTLTGSVDSKTDAQRLWLRFETATVAARRPIAWNRITAAQLAGQDIQIDDLRRLGSQVESPPWPPVRAATPRRDAVEPVPSHRPSHGSRPRVRSLDAQAWAANWDADVENDGLLVGIRPVDERGDVVPVNGTLYVDLVVPIDHGAKFERLAKWTRTVRRSDVGVGGIEFRLPFQARHPEFDTNVARFGLVHLRLAVPGHGSFERTIDDVRTRPFSPFRDDLERATGRRFLPNEHTGRGKYTAFGRL